jgi:hypothetical protein
MTGRELIQHILTAGDLDKGVVVEDTRTGNVYDASDGEYNWRIRSEGAFLLEITSAPDSELRQ